MPQYEIKEWQAVIPKDNQEPLPMVYIVGDEAFQKYAKENNFMVLVTVRNTMTPYDDKPMVASVESSGYFPEYRPNFFNKTNYYVLTLFSVWGGYPPNNGIVEIQGNEGPDKLPVAQPKPFQVPVPLEWYQGPKTSTSPAGPTEGKTCGYSTTSLLLVILAIFMVFGALFIFSPNFKKR